MLYQITEKNKEVSLVSILRDIPLEIHIQNKYLDKLKEVFTKYSYLLMGDKMVSLFEQESILDYIEKSWVYNEDVWKDYNRIVNMSGEDITKLFSDYFLYDKIPEWLEVCRYHTPDEMRTLYEFGSAVSDYEILDDIMVISFDTIEGKHARISPQRVDGFAVDGTLGSSSKYNFDKGVDWKALISSMRKRYDLKVKENPTAEYAVAKGVENFVKGLAPHSKEIQEKIILCASSSSNHTAFKAEAKKTLQTNGLALACEAGGCGGCGEGYSLNYHHGFNKGEFKIQRYGIINAYEGKEDFDRQSMSESLGTFKDDKLWRAVYDHYSAELFSVA